jgi:surface polysaccharide O-acyltransferase-like enzyme
MTATEMRSLDLNDRIEADPSGVAVRRVVEPRKIKPKPPRNEGIDAFRYVCAAVVILFHTLPSKPPVPHWAANMATICFIAVPFFFVSSGYFLHAADRFNTGLVVRPLCRLLPIYLFWMLAYGLLLKLLPVHAWSFSARDLLWGGPAYHLWFIPALAVALAFVGVGMSTVGPKLTGIACLLLACIAVTRGAYHDVLGLAGTASTHDGQLAAPLYIYTGMMIRRYPVAISWRWWAGLTALCVTLAFTENRLIIDMTGTPMFLGHDVLVSTFPLGAVAFMLARTVPKSWFIGVLARLGQVSLSVYVVHLFIVWLLLPTIGNDSPGRVILLTSLVLGLSTGLSFLLQRIPVLRPFVL